MKRFIPTLIVLFFTANCFATVWTINTSGNTFVPDSITITQGDTVTFVLGAGHNAQEVDSANWAAGVATPVIGFQTAFSVTENVTGLTTGVHYYVCANHAGAGMKGKIVVQPAPPSLQFILTSLSVNEGVGNFGIAVSITNPDANPTMVDVNVVAGGSATAGVDYTYAPVTVTFPGGSQTTQIVTVNITDDQILEGQESFTFQLSSPTNNATIGVNGQHTVTIIDNDSLKLDINPHQQIQYENMGPASISVNLNHTSPNPTSVTLHLVPGGTTATQDTDFIFNDTTITWAANTSGVISVPIAVINDTLSEPDEFVRIQLINATNGATFITDTFQLIIRNNDTLVIADCSELFFTEYSMDDEPGRAIEIFNPTSQPVDLSEYRVLLSVDGASIRILGLDGMLAPNDVYVIADTGSQQVILAQADTITPFLYFDGNDALALLHFTDTVDVIGVVGENPGGGSWAAGTGSTYYNVLVRNPYTYKGDPHWSNTYLTWLNFGPNMFDSLGFHRMAACGSTPPVATVYFTTPGITVAESFGTPIPVIVETINPTTGLISFRVGHNNIVSSATVNTDYTFPEPGFTHGPGVYQDTLYAVVLEDQLLEATETAVLYLNNFSGNGHFIADSVFNLNITDNDVLTVSFNGAGYSYVEDSGLVEVKLTLSGSVANTTLVSVSLAPGNAVRGVDFQFNDTTIAFPPFSMDTQGVWVRIIDDHIIEPNEQINFNLTDPTNGAFPGIIAYTLTIIDNDSPSGVDDVDLAAGIKVYPNPVTNKLVVDAENALRNVTVTDLMGNTVMNVGELAPGKNILDVSVLSPGMYFIVLHDEQKILSKRFVKQD